MPTHVWTPQEGARKRGYCVSSPTPRRSRGVVADGAGVYTRMALPLGCAPPQAQRCLWPPSARRAATRQALLNPAWAPAVRCVACGSTPAGALQGTRRRPLAVNDSCVLGAKSESRRPVHNTLPRRVPPQERSQRGIAFSVTPAVHHERLAISEPPDLSCASGPLARGTLPSDGSGRCPLGHAD